MGVSVTPVDKTCTFMRVVLTERVSCVALNSTTATWPKRIGSDHRFLCCVPSNLKRLLGLKMSIGTCTGRCNVENYEPWARKGQTSQHATVSGAQNTGTK